MTKAQPSFDASLIQATPETALEAIAGATDRAPLLVEAWVHAKNAAAVAVVAERGNGPARKAARRGLNVLRARGVPVPERARIATLPKSGEEVVEGFLLAPDATGTELFAISARAKTSRGRALLVFLHPVRGVLRVGNHTLSQSQLKEHLASLSPTSGYGAARVPVEWVRHRIALARKIHAEQGIPEPMGFATGRELLEPVPVEAPGHPFDDEGFELSDEDALELAKGAVELHRLPEFRGWFPPQAALQQMLFNVGQRLTPGQKPEADVLDKLLKEELDAATDRYFAPQVREELVLLMKDSALSVLAREGEQRALELVAVMKAIQSRALVTDPPHEVPFLRGFFEKALTVAAMQSGGRLNLPVPQSPLAARAAEEAPAEETAAIGESSPAAEPQ